MMAGWHGHDKEPSGEPLIHIMKLYNIAEIEKLHVQLAACQAENLRLRETVKAASSHVKPTCFDLYEQLQEALSTPSGDKSALREVIALVLAEVEHRRWATKLAIDQLRSGEWTPEVLR